MKATLIDVGTFALHDAQDRPLYWKQGDRVISERCATAGICAGASRVPVTVTVALNSCDARQTILATIQQLSPYVDEEQELNWKKAS